MLSHGIRVGRYLHSYYTHIHKWVLRIRNKIIIYTTDTNPNGN